MPILTPNYIDLNHEEMAASIGLKAKHIPMLIGSFLDESKPILIALDSFIADKNYNSIKEQTHSIKGSAGNLRFNEIYEMAKEMELSATQSDENFDYIGYLQAIKKAVDTISL